MKRKKTETFAEPAQEEAAAEKAKNRHGKLYYAAVAACALVLVAAVVLMAVFLAPQGNDFADDPADEEQPAPPDDDEEDDGQGTVTEVVFSMPVEEAQVSESFAFWFNSTLNRYCLHTGVDFAAEAGTEVTAAYAGTVKSVTENILEGAKIVLAHSNGLCTVYASVDAASGLRAGDSVAQGEAIGTVSAAADVMGNEYAEGPHLHFEVLQGEKQIDPASYLDYEEK